MAVNKIRSIIWKADLGEQIGAEIWQANNFWRSNNATLTGCSVRLFFRGVYPESGPVRRWVGWGGAFVPDSDLMNLWSVGFVRSGKVSLDLLLQVDPGPG